MRTDEQLKLEIVHRVLSGELDRSDACSILKISIRTLKRYLRNYKNKGIGFIKHGNFRKPPHNKIQDQFKERIMRLAEDKYFDFNISHLEDALKEEMGLKLSYSTLRRWCHEKNLVKNIRRKRRSKPRKARLRMSQEGYMLQLDGSHHHWFGGRYLCLMAAIDDATNEVFAKFYEGETTWACLNFLEEIVRKNGVMKFIYTDRAGLYGGLKRENFSQVERALGELGSHVIYAQSAEGKGRVERLFRTLQDRLVAELRLNGIGSIEDANRYLSQVYLPHKHNPKFMVKAHNHVSGYRSLPKDINLSEIFCVKKYRIIGKDHTVSIKNERWMIADDIRYSIAGKRLELRFNSWGEWQAMFAGKPLKLVKVKKAQRLA